MKTKRLLALILTLVMLGSMLPATFAADAAPASASLEYVFNNTVFNEYSGGTILLRPGQASEAAAKSYTVNTALTDEWKYVNCFGTRNGGFQTNELQFNKLSTVGKNEAAVILQITVPTTGFYTPSVDHAVEAAHGAQTDLYLIDVDWAKRSYSNLAAITNVQAVINAASMTNPMADVKHVASYDFSKASGNDELAGKMFLTAGDYYLIITPNQGANAAYQDNFFFADIKSLTLTPDNSTVYAFSAEAATAFTGDPSTTATIAMNTAVKSYADLDTSFSPGEWFYYGGSKAKSVTMYSDLIDGTTFSIDAANSGNNAFILKAKVPAAGTYKPSMIYKTYSSYGKMDVYFVPVSYADEKWSASAASWDFANVFADSGVKHVISQDGAASLASNILGTYDDVELEAGEYYFLMSVTATGGANFLTEGIILTPQPKLTASESQIRVEAGKTAKVSATLAYGDGSVVTADSVSYESSASNVATVASDGTVTGKSEGVATITITASYNGATFTDKVSVIVLPETASDTVSLAINIDGEITVQSWNRGETASVAAPEIDGYTFRHWVRGTADNGVWVSDEAYYEFEIVTNTYLTAIYTENTDAQVVEFFNGNGEFLSQAVAVDGKVALPANPSLTGFKFLRWITGADKELTADTVLTKDVTYAVAEYVAADSGYIVEGESYNYDDAVTETSATPVAWYRDGVQVAYGTSYTYYVWYNVGEITSGEGEQKPLVVLDEHVKGDASYMIEYDAGDKEIVEVGIIFGDSDNITVASCSCKATSQKDLTHGQFTAKPNGDESVARGYMIYRDGGSLKIIYND